MGLLNSALHVGRNALLGSQAALQVVGNNISSSASPDYTRLSPTLNPLIGTPTDNGLQPGAGVALTGIQRNIDEALEGRIRLATGELTSTITQQGTLAQIETHFDDLTGTGIGSQMQEFFNRLNDLSTDPQDSARRDLVRDGANLLSDAFSQLRQDLLQISADADSKIEDVVVQADRLVQEVADLNTQITQSEAGPKGEAAALRDRRDALLRELSQLFEVTVKDQENGSINVYVGSELLVQGGIAREIKAETEYFDGQPKTSVRFADTNQQLSISGGQLGGLIISRDEFGGEQIDAIDKLAGAFVFEVNKIHADGQGKAAYTSLTGEVELLATDVSLAESGSGLDFPPQNGSFYITVIDQATGTPVSSVIDVSLNGDVNDTTLESLVADINAQVNGVTTSITPDNRIKFEADDGIVFTFGHDGQSPRSDTSNVLASLGVNSLFAGKDAGSIEISRTIRENPDLIATSSVFALQDDGTNMLIGNNEIANRLALLDSDNVSSLGGTSLVDFYNNIATGVAVDVSAINEEVEARSSVMQALDTQKQSISGVSLDEEAISLLKFERAFQGAARYVSVVNDMLGELMALVN